jgi:hypothetical protein
MICLCTFGCSLEPIGSIVRRVMHTVDDFSSSVNIYKRWVVRTQMDRAPSLGRDQGIQ